MATTLKLPLTPDRVGDLRAGEDVALSGRVLTFREAALRLLATRPDAAVDAALAGGVVYLCAPVVAPDAGGGWRVLAAGPSPAAAAERWAPGAIARTGAAAVMGKGSPGAATRAALGAQGAIYLQPAAALSVTLARRVVRVRGVHLLEALGVTEAIWDLEVEGFPAVVLVDARGEALDGRRDAAGAAGAAP